MGEFSSISTLFRFRFLIVNRIVPMVLKMSHFTLVGRNRTEKDDFEDFGPS